MSETLMTKPEVAELLTVSVSTIDRIRKEKGFPKPFKIGGTLRWNPHEIVAWLRKQR